MGPAERALVAPERLQGCVRELEAEKAKMEVFRRELPISVRLVADVIEWLKDELKAQPEGGRAEADDKSSWMSSAQLWTCGGGLDHTTGNGSDQAHKLSTPPTALPSLAGSTRAAAERPVAVPLPDLSLSSPATAPSAATTSSSRRSGRPGGAGRPSCTAGSSPLCSGSAARKVGVTAADGWIFLPTLMPRALLITDRRAEFAAATPKQIRELMKVDGLTNDEVKSHLQACSSVPLRFPRPDPLIRRLRISNRVFPSLLQKYRLHTRRGGDQQAEMALWSGTEQQQQYTASRHSSSPQSGSPQGPLQLTVSMTRGDSCDGDEEDGKSEGYSWEMQQPGTKSSSS